MTPIYPAMATLPLRSGCLPWTLREIRCCTVRTDSAHGDWRL